MSKSNSPDSNPSIPVENSSDQINHPWIGYSFPSRFVVSKEDLEDSVEIGINWFENINKGEPSQTNEVIYFSPTREDALTNSKGSGDGNILHDDYESVKRFIDEYERLARTPVQDTDVVLSQGMSVKDILAHSGEFGEPVKELAGSWQNMVYAAENTEESDKVIVKENNGDYTPIILPGGDPYNPIPGEDGRSGGVEPVYANDSEEFADDHNVQMVSMEDLAVGRGLQTPSNIRYGELLISNEFRVNTEEIPDEFDLDQLWEGDEYIFNLEELEKQRLGVKGHYRVDVNYGDETLENAISYSEDALYAKDFHEKMDLSKELEEAGDYSNENRSASYPNPFALMLKAQADSLRQFNRML